MKNLVIAVAAVVTMGAFLFPVFKAIGLALGQVSKTLGV